MDALSSTLHLLFIKVMRPLPRQVPAVKWNYPPHFLFRISISLLMIFISGRHATLQSFFFMKFKTYYENSYYGNLNWWNWNTETSSLWFFLSHLIQLYVYKLFDISHLCTLYPFWTFCPKTFFRGGRYLLIKTNINLSKRIIKQWTITLNL